MRQFFVNLYYCLLLLALVGCGPSKSSSDPELIAEQFKALQTLIESKNFKFEAEISYPLQTAAVSQVANSFLKYTGNTGSRIRLDAGFYMRVRGDSAKATLPFIGEIRDASLRNSKNGNISFNNVHKDYSYDYTPKNASVIVEFKTTDGTESFDVLLEAFPNRFATLSVSSSKRTQIRYSGTLKPNEQVK
jgi:hypothetical protein